MLFLAYQCMLAELGARVWGEYVESDANCSDGPSREGMQCAFWQDMEFELFEAIFPMIPDLRNAPLALVMEAFE